MSLIKRINVKIKANNNSGKSKSPFVELSCDIKGEGQQSLQRVSNEKLKVK